MGGSSRCGALADRVAPERDDRPASLDLDVRLACVPVTLAGDDRLALGMRRAWDEMRTYGVAASVLPRPSTMVVPLIKRRIDTVSAELRDVAYRAIYDAEPVALEEVQWAVVTGRDEGTRQTEHEKSINPRA